MQQKVRTARRSFTDSFGRTVNAGEQFIIVELRPIFYSRRWLEDALAALQAEPKKKPVKEAKRAH
jgi:hypothetical protein